MRTFDRRSKSLLPLAKKAAIVTLYIVTAFAIAFSAPAGPAQTVITLDSSYYAAGPRLKLDNGFLVTWAPSSEASPQNQIEVFDSQGRESMSLNLLDSIPGAKKAVISDVAVSPGGLVAVGAQVFRGKHHGKSALLLLDSSGQLYESISFDKGLGVSKVEIDSNQNIWVLRMGAGMADPAKVPVLAEYDRDGNLLGGFLHFSDFDKDAKIVHGGFTLGGDVQMGTSHTRVWFWLPSSRELVTLFTDGTGLQRMTTGLPPWPGTEPAGGIVRVQRCSWIDPNSLLCQVAFLTAPAGSATAQSALYQFATDTQRWTPVPSGTAPSYPGTFLGIDQNNAVFVTFDSTNDQISLESAPLAP